MDIKIMEFLMKDLPQIAQAILVVIGGLKVIARYTPMQADDHVLDKIEAPVKWCLEKFFGKKEEPPKED